MARSRRRLGLLSLALIVFGTLIFGHKVTSRNQGLAWVELQSVASVSFRAGRWFFSAAVPSFLFATSGYLLRAQRDHSLNWRWCALAAAIAGGILMPWASGELFPPALAQTRVATTHSARPGPVQMPHSGEERLIGDGQFLRIADPRHTQAGAADAGWRAAIWENMTSAIQLGDAQVVLVFSRQGCPWCDRLVPVLQRAIKLRADGRLNAEDTFEHAPLRVFVLDATEFPGIIQQFHVDAFPSMLVFGSPGVTPHLSSGFLEDDSFQRLTQKLAKAKPDPIRPAKRARKKRWWLSR